MAGSPLKRQRKAGIRAEDGSVIAFPYMPRVADLPRGWRHWSPAQKIEHLLGMSLDRAHEILSWRPIIELDPPHLSLWEQVWRVVFMVGTKALLGGKLGREAAHERDLDEAVRRFDRADRAQPIGWWGKTGAAASAYSGKTRERGRGWSDERGEPSKAARDFRKTGRVAIPRAKQTRSDRLMTSSEVMNLEP